MKRTATNQEIREAWIQGLLQCHPDLCGSDKTQEAQLLNAAYQAIKEQRKQFGQDEWFEEDDRWMEELDKIFQSDFFEGEGCQEGILIFRRMANLMHRIDVENVLSGSEDPAWNQLLDLLPTVPPPEEIRERSSKIRKKRVGAGNRLHQLPSEIAANFDR